MLGESLGERKIELHAVNGFLIEEIAVLPFYQFHNAKQACAEQIYILDDINS